MSSAAQAAGMIQANGQLLDEDATVDDMKALHAQLVAARSFALQAMNALQVCSRVQRWQRFVLS